MSVKEIETAISELTAEDFAELSTWLDEFQARVWDRKIEEDLETGRLDALLKEVDKECDAGLDTPL